MTQEDTVAQTAKLGIGPTYCKKLRFNN